MADSFVAAINSGEVDRLVGLMAVLRREINAIDPSELQVASIETVKQIFARDSADSRFRALLVMFFGAVAMGITCLGLFGVLTHAVAQRTRELGIRVALGAGRSQIIGLVLSQGARMVGLGVALGLVLVFWVTRYISSLLFWDRTRWIRRPWSGRLA